MALNDLVASTLTHPYPPPPSNSIFINTADRGSGVDFLTVSAFLGESGTLVKTKEHAVRSQIINILWVHFSPTRKNLFQQ